MRGKRIRLLGVAASELGEREQLGDVRGDDVRAGAGRSRRPTRSGERFGTRAVTRARLLRAGHPGAVRAGPRTAAGAARRAAEDVRASGVRGARRRRDSQADTTGEDAFDDEA